MRKEKRVKPIKAKWCPRSIANEINDMFYNAQKPDRTALEKESQEYLDYLRAKKLSRTASN